MPEDRPPLEPKRERQFYHYRHGVLIDVVTMNDGLALYRVEHGQDLWPVEWGPKHKEPK